MRLSPIGWSVVLGLTACGLPDVLSAPGLKPIVLAYVGSDTLPLGETRRVMVTVEAGGELFPNPRLRVASSDPTVMGVIGADSIIGLQMGAATLTVQLVSSIFSDSLPTLTHAILVRPKPPGLAPP